MKRTLIIILVIVIMVAVVWFLIFFFHGKLASNTTSGTTGSLPSVGTQSSGIGGASGANGTAGTTSSSVSQVNLAAQGPVLNYFIDAQGDIFIVEPNGTITETIDGQASQLSTSAINNLQTAEFSYDGKEILVSYGESTGIQWSIFDIATKSWTLLPPSFITAAWSPSDYRVAYFANTNGATSLEVLDTSNAKAKPKLLASLPDEDFQISWNGTSTILLTDKSSGLFSGSILSVNATTGAIASVVQSKVGLEAVWNQDATIGLIFVGTQSARGGQLGMIDNAGNLSHTMNFLTLPSKCVFTDTAVNSAATSTPELICAIPRDTQTLDNSLLPDAYNEEVVMTSDDFYSVNLVTGDTGPVFVNPSDDFDVSDVQLFNNDLFFVNRYDQKLYALSLTAATSTGQ